VLLCKKNEGEEGCMELPQLWCSAETVPTRLIKAPEQCCPREELRIRLGSNTLALTPSLLSLIGLRQLGYMVGCLHVAVEITMATTGGCEPTAFLWASDILRTCSVSPSLPLKPPLNLSLCSQFSLKQGPILIC
jgi:hypothetical protein